MSRDEIIEQATKVMHAAVCCSCDPQGCDWTHTPEARYAWVLADAGLLAPVEIIEFPEHLNFNRGNAVKNLAAKGTRGRIANTKSKGADR